ncbi:unnamed protein product [Camellia sinensis]
MEIEGFLYDALSPLSSSAAATPTGQPPPPVEVSEPYVVFRNEILLTATHCPSPKNAAVDYFSLDVCADDDDDEEAAVDLIAIPATPAQVPEPERTLEGGWFRANCRFKSPMLQLHKEILDFCEFLSPTPEEQASRNAAVECVFDVVRYIWPNSKVEVFGSFKTGLYLPTSDIDVRENWSFYWKDGNVELSSSVSILCKRLLLVVILGSDIKTPQIGLQALARALSQRGIAKKIQVIAKARVPIVKFVEKRSGVAFDISFDLQNGPKAAEFIKNAVSKMPPLRPLCLILKVFLQQRELNEVYTGGIGSYALLAMLIAMLRSLSEQQAYPEHNLGILLSSRGFTVKGRPFLLSIEDPQAPENDIGKNSFSYFQVRSAFAMAFSTLTNTKTILSLGPNRSILGTIIRPDPVLLERKGGSTGEMTFNNLLPGAGEPLELHNGDPQELCCNWRLDDEEEPLPRGNGIVEYASMPSSSGKKRKSSSKEEKGSKKAKENGETGKVKHEESGSVKEKGKKKQRWRHYRDGSHSSNGFNRYGGGSPWNGTS